jgi:hypothetical protein
VRGEGEGGADVRSVSLIVVAACVLDRLVTGADVWSARVVPLGFADGSPMSVTGDGSVACAIVLMRWVRMLELHCRVGCVFRILSRQAAVTRWPGWFAKARSCACATSSLVLASR